MAKFTNALFPQRASHVRGGPRDASGMAYTGPGEGEGHTAVGFGAALYAAAHGRQRGQMF